MKLTELMEGVEPKLPGAPRGVTIMTPQQFVAKSGDMPDEETAEGVVEGAHDDAMAGLQRTVDFAKQHGYRILRSPAGKVMKFVNKAIDHTLVARVDNEGDSINVNFEDWNSGTSGNDDASYFDQTFKDAYDRALEDHKYRSSQDDEDEVYEQGIAEGEDHLSRIRKLSGLDEATKLPADTRELKGQELDDYLDRIRTQDKKKTDKYKLPYIHRSSVIGYYDEAGKKYNTDAIKKALAERPKSLLKKNEKMKHSDGELEQFFNIGFAALVGIALDQQTNEIIVVNTCPGAGSCKVDCFAMKGGKIQFAGPWLSDGRILTYLLNDPDGFFNQLTAEISKEELKGKKGGYRVSIRWHDAGDFFSPEYMAMAFKLAESLPNVDFYAYTKIAAAALAQKPENFIINWSEGASTSQEKQVKAQDPKLDSTKNSRIVPSNLFYDLLVKDEKKNLVKGPEGQWQVIPDKLPELKQRLAKEYGISANSILSYNEWETKGKNNPMMKWNVIITPGEPDVTAKDPGVLSTLLLKH